VVDRDEDVEVPVATGFGLLLMVEPKPGVEELWEPETLEPTTPDEEDREDEEEMGSAMLNEVV